MAGRHGATTHGSLVAVSDSDELGGDIYLAPPNTETIPTPFPASTSAALGMADQAPMRPAISQADTTLAAHSLAATSAQNTITSPGMAFGHTIALVRLAGILPHHDAAADGATAPLFP